MKRLTVIRAYALIGVASLVLAACSSSATVASGAACANTKLVTGTVLPKTGDRAFLGPPEFAGVKKAVDEINANGGVLGQPMTNIDGDSGDASSDIAFTTVDSHLAHGVQVIIGASSSAVSLRVIDKITSQGVLMMSPGNTSPELTTYPDHNLYWRVAPSDSLQGAVIASTATDLGLKKVAVIARQDAYGDGLAAAFSKDFVKAGGTVSSELRYDPDAEAFQPQVAAIKAGAPEAVVVIGYVETAKVLQEMIKQGVGPADLQVFLVDANLSTEAYKDLPQNVMTGVLATLPSGETDLTAFNKSMLEVDPSLTDFTYAPQAYEATILVALAAQAAGCADGTAIVGALADAAGDGGEKCTTYADCLALLKAGKYIDFVGVTGPLDFNKYGDPAMATIAINKYTSNSTFEEISKVTAEVPLP